MDSAGENRIIFRDLVECLKTCENYSEEGEKIARELAMEGVVQSLFYLVNTHVSLAGFCVVEDGELYSSGEIGVYGLKKYPCKSGTAKPCRIIQGAKVRSLYDIAKENSESKNNFLKILRVITKSGYFGDLCFFAKRVSGAKADVERAIEEISKAQEKTNKFARAIER